MQRAPPAASTTQQLCVTRSTPTAFDASWPSASTLACKGFAAWGCVSPLPAPSYQQSEKFTRALRRKLRPSDAALLVVPVPAAPAHAFLDPAISDPVFGFGSEAGRPPKGRSRVAIGEGAERRVISVAPLLAAVRLACLKDALAAVAVWLPHDLSGILKALQVARRAVCRRHRNVEGGRSRVSSNASRIRSSGPSTGTRSAARGCAHRRAGRRDRRSFAGCLSRWVPDLQREIR